MIADSLPISAESLLLGQLLFPFAAAVAIPVGFSSSRRCALMTQAALWLLAAISLFLLVASMDAAMLTLSGERASGASFTVEWTLWGKTVVGRFERIVLQADATSAALTALLPWAALTILAFLGQAITRTQCVAIWLIIGATGVFLTADDLVSMVTAWSVVVGVVAWWMAWFGSQGKRESAQQFLMVQIVSIGLMTAGLAALCGLVAIVQGAPDGPPGVTSTVWTDLSGLREAIFETHPSASLLWRTYHSMPAVLMLLGIWVSSGLFPASFWTYDRNLTANPAIRIWITILLPVFLIRLWSVLVGLDPLFDQESRGVLAWVAVAGTLVVGGRLAVLTNPEARTTAGLAWLRHLQLLTLLSLPGERWELTRIALLLSLIATGVVWGFVTSDELTVRLPSFVGRDRLFSMAAGMVLLTLGFLPGVTGMMLLWAATHPMGLAGQPGGASLVFLLLLANTLATWGVAKAVLAPSSGSRILREPAPSGEPIRPRDVVMRSPEASGSEPARGLSRTATFLATFWISLPIVMAIVLAWLW